VDRSRALGPIDVWKEWLQRSLARRRRLLVPIPVVGLVAAAALAAPQAAGAADASAATLSGPPPAKYVNPLKHAKVTPERIDMGVDYSGTGSLTAIGWARIIYVGTKNTGWPGAFIEYRLLHGWYAGRYVYYAEGVRPAQGIHVGRLVRPGRVVARLIKGWSSGIEIGWAAGVGTETLAEKYHQTNFPTKCGKNFSALIKRLGGPPGIP
jgi:hypothetical protein